MFSLKTSISSNETDLIIMFSKRNTWLNIIFWIDIAAIVKWKNIKYFWWQYNNGNIACYEKNCFTLIAVTSSSSHQKNYIWIKHIKMYEQPCFRSSDASSYNYTLSIVLVDNTVLCTKNDVILYYQMNAWNGT